MQNDFDLKEWEKTFVYFHKNKTSMEANVCISIQQSKIHVAIASINEKYSKYKKLLLTLFVNQLTQRQMTMKMKLLKAEDVCARM